MPPDKIANTSDIQRLRNYDAFICHHVDSQHDLAVHVRKAFTYLGYTAFVAQHPGEIRAGDDWREAVNEVIDHCAVFVFLINKPALESEEVKRELKRFANKDDEALFIPAIENRPGLDYQYVEQSLNDIALETGINPSSIQFLSFGSKEMLYGYILELENSIREACTGIDALERTATAAETLEQEVSRINDPVELEAGSFSDDTESQVKIWLNATERANMTEALERGKSYETAVHAVRISQEGNYEHLSIREDPDWQISIGSHQNIFTARIYPRNASITIELPINITKFGDKTVFRATEGASPYDIRFLVDENGTFSDMNLHISFNDANVQEYLDFLDLVRRLNAGDELVFELADRPDEPLYGSISELDFDEPDEETLKYLYKLAEIQKRTDTEIPCPSELAPEDVTTIDRVYTILTTGFERRILQEGTIKLANRKGIENLLQIYEAKDSPNFTMSSHHEQAIDLLGIQIPIGPIEMKIMHTRLAKPPEDIRAEIDENEPEYPYSIGIIPLPQDHTNATVKYVKWLPREERSLFE